MYDKKRRKLWWRYWTFRKHIKLLESQGDYMGAAEYSLKVIKLKKRLKL